MYHYSLPGTEVTEPEYKDSISCAVFDPGAAHISNTYDKFKLFYNL